MPHKTHSHSGLSVPASAQHMGEHVTPFAGPLAAPDTSLTERVAEFRQKIHGALTLDTSPANSLQYLDALAQKLGVFLRDWMPVDRMVFLERTLFPPSLQVRGESLLGELLPHRRTIFMTSDFMGAMEQSETLHSAVTREELVSVINDMSEYPFVGAYFGTLQEDMSYLNITLKIPARHLYLSVNAAGLHRFTKEHEAFATLLLDPLSNVVAAYFRRQQKQPETAAESMPKRRSPRLLIQDSICGFNRGLASVMQQIYRVAPTDTPVLLLGETGTGKELIANALHMLSTRSAAPFIKVNCGAIPETLIDSELFGYERGAFTGAVSSAPGWFEQADNGTLLLDEIGEMPLQAQVRLLRVLQFGEIVRLGSTRVQRVNVRIVASTHRDLEHMVADGQFRQDLWFRLSTFPIRIPPLRERKKDLEELAMLAVARKCRELNISPMPVLDAKTLQRMKAYDWPGNVRELESVVEQALIRNPASPQWEWPESSAGTGVTARAEQSSQTSLVSLDEAIRQHIERVLEHTGGKIGGPGGAAEILQINVGTLRSRMAKLGMLAPRKRG